MGMKECFPFDVHKQNRMKFYPTGIFSLRSFSCSFKINYDSLKNYDKKTALCLRFFVCKDQLQFVISLLFPSLSSPSLLSTFHSTRKVRHQNLFSFSFLPSLH